MRLPRGLMAGSRLRRGFTLIEVLVVVTIIGLLAALLIPAVQGARNAARKAQCMNNLKQLGVAMHAFEATKGTLPPGFDRATYSLHYHLLPMLEQTPLYNSINYQHSADGSGDVNATAIKTKVAVFICPSETRTPHDNETPDMGWTSYAGCRGDGRGERVGAYNGVFSIGQPPYTSKSITDGLSTTVAMSEWLLEILIGARGVDPRRHFYRPLADSGEANLDYDNFVRACAAPGGIPGGVRIKGQWLVGGNITLFNGVMPPNAPNCGRQVPASATHFEDPPEAATAASDHSGGANVLYADGHVKFVRNSINLSVWHALATRNKGEVVSGDLY